MNNEKLEKLIEMLEIIGENSDSQNLLLQLSKIGTIALIDEATEYNRPSDDLINTLESLLNDEDAKDSCSPAFKSCLASEEAAA